MMLTVMRATHYTISIAAFLTTTCYLESKELFSIAKEDATAKHQDRQGKQKAHFNNLHGCQKTQA